jgi:hypothetical protein
MYRKVGKRQESLLSNSYMWLWIRAEQSDKIGFSYFLSNLYSSLYWIAISIASDPVELKKKKTLIF